MHCAITALRSIYRKVQWSAWFTDRISWCRISFPTSLYDNYASWWVKAEESPDGAKNDHRRWWINAISSNRILLGNSQTSCYKRLSNWPIDRASLHGNILNRFHVISYLAFIWTICILRLFENRKHETKKCVSRKERFLGPMSFPSISIYVHMQTESLIEQCTQQRSSWRWKMISQTTDLVLIVELCFTLTLKWFLFILFSHVSKAWKPPTSTNLLRCDCFWM